MAKLEIFDSKVAVQEGKAPATSSLRLPLSLATMQGQGIQAITKAVGDIFPFIDPNRSLFINLSYEKTFSEANIMNYDYLADSFALSFSKALKLN